MFGGFNPISAVMEGGFKIADYMHDEEMQEDAQQFAAERSDTAARYNIQEAKDQRAWSSTEAATAREFAERMSNTQYQRAVNDLKSAGINPMLAAMHGGAGNVSGPMPSGASGSTSAGSAGIASSASGRGFNWASMQTASQIAVNEALAERTKAERDKVLAEEKEITARTPTHAAHIEKIAQDIRESNERIHRIVEETGREAASAANLRQQTINLQEAIPQIRATVQNLKALTLHTQTLVGKTQAETTEIQQRVKAALPGLEANLRELELQARQLDMPRREQDRAAHDRFTGALGALIRSLTGLGTYIK